MAPSASMLFLSYHQLHHGPAAEAEPEAPRDGAGGFRFSFRNVFSPAVLSPPRRHVASQAAGGIGKRIECHAGGDQEEEKKFPGAALGSKLEEAVEFSCWSS